MKRQNIAVVGFLLLCAAPAAFAQSLFSVNRINVYGTGAKSTTNWHGQADIQTLSVELGHALSSRTEYAFVASGYNIWQPRSWFGSLYHDGNQSVHAISGTFLVRRHFGDATRTLRPFVELSTGPMWATERVPAATSHFNFHSQFGVGATYHPNQRWGLILGWRAGHISNGGIADRNPGLNLGTVMIGAQLRAMPGR